jgi:probable HAF family extracellular repeat protein
MRPHLCLLTFLSLSAACIERTEEITASLAVFADLPTSINITLTVADLGTLGGVAAEASDVNDLGHVVGTAEREDLSSHAFLWTPASGMRDLGDLGGGRSNAFAVNNHDDVVGWSWTSSGDRHPFLWTQAGGMRDLGTFPGTSVCSAKDINDAGEVVGECGFLAFRWTAATGMVPLGELAPGFGSRAVAINNRGDVIGVADIFTGGLNLPRAFLWTSAAGMQSLGTLDPGDPISESEADDIDDAGTVVGFSFGTNFGDYFLWTADAGMRALNEPRSLGTAHINDHGDVAFYRRALRLVDGRDLSLPVLPNDPGGEDQSAGVNGLSDRLEGKILLAGFTQGPTGRTDFPRGMRAVLWTVDLGTTPAPTAQDQIAQLGVNVATFVEETVLSAGEGNALTVKLRAAAQSLDGGESRAAIHQLQAFANQVRAFERSGRLSAEQAARLRDAALAAIASIGSTS